MIHGIDCDCCRGIEPLTPLVTANRPGLSQLSYRVGTHATFLETMKARLSSTTIEKPAEHITDWLLKPQQIRRMASFIRRLQQANDPFTKHLRTQLLTEDFAEQLKDHDSNQPPDEDLQAALLEELNRILTTEQLYAPERSQHLDLTPTIQSLLAQESLSGDDFTRLNRLLFEVAYPDLIIPRQRLYPLRELTTRHVNDPTIAMLDAWATVGDILTFYQERIANEGYLPTATERLSILEMARLVGYKLRPGVAASTYLAFTIENGHELTIPAGVRAQSIPGPGELPQPFETSEDLYARDVWNNIQPRLTEPQVLDGSQSAVYLEGIVSDLKPNDPLLMFALNVDDVTGKLAEPKKLFRRVREIEVEAEASRTRLDLTGELDLTNLIRLLDNPPSPEQKQISAVTNLSPTGPVTSSIVTLSWDEPSEYLGTVFYDVDVVNDANGEIVACARDIVDPSWTITINETSENSYTWTVTAKDRISFSEKEASFDTDFGESTGSGDSGTEAVEAPLEFTPQPTFTWPDDLDPAPTKLTILTIPAAGSSDLEITINIDSTTNSYQPEIPILQTCQEYRWKLDGVQQESFTTTPEYNVSPKHARFNVAYQNKKVSEVSSSFTGNEHTLTIGTSVSKSGEFNGMLGPEDVFEGGTQYFWQVTTEDSNGNTLTSPIWRFTTAGDTDADLRKKDLYNTLRDRILYRLKGSDADGNAINDPAPPLPPLDPLPVHSTPVEPLLDKLIKSESTSKQALEYFINIQLRPLWRVVAMTKNCLFQVESNSNYNFSKPGEWFSDVANTIRNDIVPQLELIPFPLSVKRIFTESVDEEKLAILWNYLPEPPDDLETSEAAITIPTISCLEAGGCLDTELGNEGIIFENISSFNNEHEALSPDAKIREILKLLRQLQDLQVAVILYCATPLQEWLADLLETLESIILPATDGEPEPVQATEFLDSLLLSADIPAQDPFRFGRELTTLFNEESDLVNQLLTTFQPSLQNNYYQALAAKQEIDGRLKDPSELHVFRVKAAPYGARLPVPLDYDEKGNPKLCLPKDIENFVEFTETEGATHLTFDADYPEIASGQWIVIEWPPNEGPRSTVDGQQGAETNAFGDIDPDRIVRQVKAVQTITKQGYGQVTRVTLDKPWLRDGLKNGLVEEDSLLVKTTIYAQSELLPLSRRPVTAEVEGDEIYLNGLYDGLQVGRWLSIAGERTDIEFTAGIPGTELARIAGVKQIQPQYRLKEAETDEEKDIGLDIDTIHTVLQLVRPLTFRYRRDSVQIQANVAHATHGETREEVLGSGNGSQRNQSFTLKQKPLTYTSAPTVNGIESSLEVRINDVRWPETDNLIWLEGADRGYMTSTDNEQNSTVIFGDGQKGTRLPSGVENVKAVYRSGIGQLGNVDGERISLLATKPLGVKAVINPLSATGGANPETRDQARHNAPLALMALDRLVSVHDYADFTRTFAGIAKAHAVQITDGRRQFIHITIAGMNDIPISKESDLYKNLCRALHQFGTLTLPVVIEMRRLILLLINANIRLHPDHQWETVEAQIRLSLLETFSFAQRRLGQVVYLSEVLDVVQKVPGVVYVDVDLFEGVRQEDAKDLETLQKRLEKINLEKELPDLHIPVAVGMANDNLDQTEDASSNEAAHLVYLSPAVPDMLILKEVA